MTSSNRLKIGAVTAVPCVFRTSIQSSPSVEVLETMAVALQLYQGDQVDVALEIQEVAKDVVERIEVLAHRDGKAPQSSPLKRRQSQRLRNS